MDWLIGSTISNEVADRPTVYGVGIVNRNDSIKENKQAYIGWKDLLRRCYSKTHQPEKNRATVDKRWHVFETFAAWHQDNYIPGYALDKDLLSESNKVYGPDTCVYIDATLNNILHKGAGIHWNKRARKYTAQITINGQKKHLGYFTLKKQATKAYLSAKRDYYIVLANSAKYPKIISDRLKVLASRF